MLLPIAYEGEGRDGYRDQIVTCDVGVSLHSKTHPLFMKYSKGISTQCYAYIALSELVSCAFSTIPICMFITPSPPTYGENTYCRPIYVHSILTKCMPLLHQS